MQSCLRIIKVPTNFLTFPDVTVTTLAIVLDFP